MPDIRALEFTRDPSTHVNVSAWLVYCPSFDDTGKNC